MATKKKNANPVHQAESNLRKAEVESGYLDVLVAKTKADKAMERIAKGDHADEAKRNGMTPMQLDAFQRQCSDCKKWFMTTKQRDAHTEKQHHFTTLPPYCAECKTEIWRPSDAVCPEGDLRRIVHAYCAKRAKPHDVHTSDCVTEDTMCPELEQELADFFDDPMTQHYGANDCDELIQRNHEKRHGCAMRNRLSRI